LDIQHGALLVPQPAVMDLQGTRQLAILDSGNKIRIQTVKVGETFDKDWIISEGVKPGERVVVEGIQQVRQGMQVDPKPYVVR
jgi:membrane fusion protein (multidrug efflux system)